MRMLTNIFIMVVATTLSTMALASIATRVANVAQQASQPMQLQQQATNQPTTQIVIPYAAPRWESEQLESVMLPGSQILAGNPDNNEFFIVGEGEPTPKPLVEAQKQAEEHVKPIQVAIDEAKKTIQEMNLPKLEHALGENTHKIDTQAQATKVVQAALQPSPATAQAENDVNPQLGNMLAAPVISDATTAAPATEKAPATTKAVKKNTQPVKKTPHKKKITKSSEDKKASIKHVFKSNEHNKKSNVVMKTPHKEIKKVASKVNAKQDAKPKTPVMTTTQSSAKIKALLAKVEVVKADFKSTAKKQASLKAKPKVKAKTVVSAKS